MKSVSEPKRRGCDFNVFGNARRIARAELRVFYFNTEIVFYSVAFVAAEFRRVVFKRQSVCRGNLPCKPDNGQTVGAVRRDFKLKNIIVKLECVYYVLTDFNRKINYEYSVLNCAREIVSSKPQFSERAKHTVSPIVISAIPDMQTISPADALSTGTRFSPSI